MSTDSSAPSVSVPSLSVPPARASIISSDQPDISRLSISQEPVKFRGKLGKPMNVTSNYLKIISHPNTGVYEYEVRFTPNVDMRNERFRLIRQAEELIGTTRVS